MGYFAMPYAGFLFRSAAQAYIMARIRPYPERTQHRLSSSRREALKPFGIGRNVGKSRRSRDVTIPIQRAVRLIFAQAAFVGSWCRSWKTTERKSASKAV